MTISTPRALLALLFVLIALAIGGAVPRGATVRGESQANGWGAITQATSPNGARLHLTGTQHSSFEATSPNGTRLALDLFPERTFGLGESYLIF